MSERRTPSIDQVEHDGSFGVRKVSNFIDNGAGGVVRQAGDALGNPYVKEKGMSGTGADTTITLTSANTAYAVPASAPTTDYILVLSNQSDTNMTWGFQNTGTLGNVLVASTGLVSMRLAGSVVIYARCASAGKVLNYSTKIV